MASPTNNTFTANSSYPAEKIDALTVEEQQQNLLADFDALESHVRQASLSQNHPAVLVALDALGKEKLKLQRDWKLQAKFQRQQQPSAVLPAAVLPQSVLTNAPIAQLPMTDVPAANDGDDWQDVAMEDEQIDTYRAGNSEDSFPVAALLARQAVMAVAQAHVRVTTPLQAFATILHAALVSDSLQFVGTTTTAIGTNRHTTFAAPVRELPRDQFLPIEFWEQTKAAMSDPCPVSRVVLRYRQKALGAVLLHIEQHVMTLHETTSTSESRDMDRPEGSAETRYRVSLIREMTQQSPLQWMEFDLHQYLNILSFEKAREASSEKTVEPALHFKNLASLLFKFCTTFDTGLVMGKSEEISQHPASGSVNSSNEGLVLSRSDNDSEPTKRIDTHLPPHRVPTTIGQAFPPLSHGHGQFDGDLFPNLDMIIGCYGGGAGTYSPTIEPGNLMGPNHPAWTAGDNPYLHRVGPVGGPGTMQPRYDPFGPPLGPTDPRNNNDGGLFQTPGRSDRIPPGGTGVPNNTMLQPPNLDNTSNIFPQGRQNRNMFS